jgi:hypothetical protein
MAFLLIVDGATVERALVSLSPEQFKVWALCRLRCGRGTMRWGQAKIAEHVGMSLATLKRALRYLLKTGWIQATRTGKASVYSLPADSSPVSHQEEPRSLTSERSDSSPVSDGSDRESLYTKRKETQNASAFRAKIAAIDREGDAIVITPKHASLYGALYGDITERRLLAQQYGVSRCEVRGGSWENPHCAGQRENKHHAEKNADARRAAERLVLPGPRYPAFASQP